MHPETGVLLLSQDLVPAYARELLETGEESVGYLLKDRVADMDEFAGALRRVAEGEVVLDAEIDALAVVRQLPEDAGFRAPTRRRSRSSVAASSSPRFFARAATSASWLRVWSCSSSIGPSLFATPAQRSFRANAWSPRRRPRAT